MNISNSGSFISLNHFNFIQCLIFKGVNNRGTLFKHKVSNGYWRHHLKSVRYTYYVKVHFKERSTFRFAWQIKWPIKKS